VRFRDAADAVRHGIAMVSQETAVAEDLTVAENVLLGRMPRGPRGIDWAAGRRQAAGVLARLGLDYDPRWIVRRLRPDQKQMVEIARALSLDAQVLILDEPTSTLTDDEVTELFAALRELKRRQVAVLFVSHRLEELFRISDDLTVLRDGQTVSAGPASSYTPASLVQAMVGAVDLHGEPVAPVTREGGDARPVLAVRGATCPGAFADVDLELRPGEVVGVAGLVGSGRSELLEAVFGARALGGGTIEVHGVARPRMSPRAAIAAGIGYVPWDRKTQGLVLPMSVRHNLTMVAAYRAHRLIPPNTRTERRLATRLAATVRLRAASMSLAVGSLSGGNQQKVVLGKWLGGQPRILLLDEPTRGVDVAAKSEIHTQLRQAAADGLALLVTSAEIPELIDLCDEILVMNRGRVTHRFSKGQATEAAVATAAAGGPTPERAGGPA
jgi:ABC-type sugar transport system ATPase subunit